MSGLGPNGERRDKTFAGAWNRAQFNLSLKSLVAFGFSIRVVEYCREHARKTGRLPHELVIEMVEEAIVRASAARAGTAIRRPNWSRGAFP